MEIIRVPQLNANEEEVEVVEVSVEEGDLVERGDLLCTLESTKATLEMEASAGGYVRRWSIQAGQRVAVGALICALTETLEEPLQLSEEPTPTAVHEGVRATRRAEALIAEYDIDIAALGNGGIITERDVLQHLGEEREDLRAPDDKSEPAKVRVEPPRGEGIVIYGAGGHARVVIDMLREARRDLNLVGIVDDSPQRPDEVLGVPVVGEASRLGDLRDRGVRMAALGVGAVTHNALRAELFERLVQAGFALPNIIHPDATVESSVNMGRGNQIFAGAVLSSSAQLGDNAIINSNVVVSHDCQIGDHVHLTPGALLAGGVSVGERTVIGMGVTVYLGVDVGADVVVPNGDHVLEDIVESGMRRVGGRTR